MKFLITAGLISFFGVMADAQNNSTTNQPAATHLDAPTVPSGFPALKSPASQPAAATLPPSTTPSDFKPLNAPASQPPPTPISPETTHSEFPPLNAPASQPPTTPIPSQTIPNEFPPLNAPAPRPAPNTTPEAQPAPAKAHGEMTLEELKKKQGNTVALLKNKYSVEIKTLRESLSGKPRAEALKAVQARKTEQKAALKELENTNTAELERFKKDHPRTYKKTSTTPPIKPYSK